MGFCLENLRRVVYEGFSDEADDDPFPYFAYLGQISKGEVYSKQNCLALLLKENCLLVGIIVEFKCCAKEEIDLVLDQIYEIAYEIIDFSIMIDQQSLYSIVNPDYTGDSH